MFMETCAWSTANAGGHADNPHRHMGCTTDCPVGHHSMAHSSSTSPHVSTPFLLMSMRLAAMMPSCTQQGNMHKGAEG